MHINYSVPWKHGNITREDPNLPKQAHFNKKDFLGFFLENHPQSCKEIKQQCELLEEKIRLYFPEYHPRIPPALLIFPLLLIG